MLERRRCHPLYIVERLFGMLVPIVLYIVAVFGGAIDDMEMTVQEVGSTAVNAAGSNAAAFLYIAVSIIGFLALLVLFIWLGWRNIWISAEDNTLIYESGIITKKRTTIPFSKINTIDMSRNVFQRLLGTCRLKVSGDFGRIVTVHRHLVIVAAQ